MNLRELFESELRLHDLDWCRGKPLDFCDFRSSHKRGFFHQGVVHFDAEIATRATFLTGLHEIGHALTEQKGRRYERETEAQAWAERRSRELGVPVSRKQHDAYAQYVARMKRWGDNIAAGR